MSKFIFYLQKKRTRKIWPMNPGLLVSALADNTINNTLFSTREIYRHLCNIVPAI